MLLLRPGVVLLAALASFLLVEATSIEMAPMEATGHVCGGMLLLAASAGLMAFAVTRGGTRGMREKATRVKEPESASGGKEMDSLGGDDARGTDPPDGTVHE